MTAKEIVAVLEKLGFEFSRQSGSHKIYMNRAGVRATVPYHGSKILHPKVIKTIIKDAGIVTKRLIEIMHS